MLLPSWHFKLPLNVMPAFDLMRLPSCMCPFPRCVKHSDQGDGLSLVPHHNQLGLPQSGQPTDKSLLSVDISLLCFLLFFLHFIYFFKQHFIVTVLKRTLKKFLEYLRSSSRTWDIFSVSCTQLGCLHNHSLRRNHGEIRSSCACLRKSAINVSECIMEQTVHGRRLELLCHSLRNYRLILTCFSWLTFQLKTLST